MNPYVSDPDFTLYHGDVRQVLPQLDSARVAYRISDGGRDWSAWATHRLCGL